jgi:hypothetical protein
MKNVPQQIALIPGSLEKRFSRLPGIKKINKTNYSHCIKKWYSFELKYWYTFQLK